MKCVKDSQDLVQDIHGIKAEPGGLISNYYFNAAKLDSWIKSQALYSEVMGKTLFLSRVKEAFFYLYFISPSLKDFKRDIGIWEPGQKVFVAEIVGRDKDKAPIISILEKKDFSVYTTLIRMQKIRNPLEKMGVFHDDVEFARPEDATRLIQYFYENLDLYAEQFPTLDEMLEEIANRNVILIRADNRIGGFVIFDNKKRTSHLRYWHVNPDYRDRHLGSKLLHSYFSLSSEAERFILWVISTNDNAIKRYRHYGYREDILSDTVMINRRRSYHEK